MTIISANNNHNNNKSSSKRKSRNIVASEIDIDRSLDKSLRPKRFDDYIGQTQIKNTLFISIKAAKQRGESIDHLLLYGPSWSW